MVTTTTTNNRVNLVQGCSLNIEQSRLLQKNATLSDGCGGAGGDAQGHNPATEANRQCFGKADRSSLPEVLLAPDKRECIHVGDSSTQ